MKQEIKHLKIKNIKRTIEVYSYTFTKKEWNSLGDLGIKLKDMNVNELVDYMVGECIMAELLNDVEWNYNELENLIYVLDKEYGGVYCIEITNLKGRIE
jgi:hypothetical protein